MKIGVASLCLMQMVLPFGHAVADNGQNRSPSCCNLILPPNYSLLDPTGGREAPGPERPAPDPAYVSDLPSKLSANPLFPPMHPSARNADTRLCMAPPDTVLGSWFKERMAYSDRSRAEPISGRRSALAYACW
jgi:hypothetical protein